MTITEAFDLYRVDVILDRNQSCSTEESHVCAMKSLVRFFGDVEIGSLTRIKLREWRASLESRNFAPNSVRGYIIKLRVVLRYLRSEGMDVLDPDKIGVPKRTPGRIEFLTPDEISRLIRACDIPASKHIYRARNKAVIALLFSTGLRVSELCRLDRSHLASDSFSVQIKGGQHEVFFVDASARKYVNAYLAMRRDNNPALFVSDQRLKLRLTPNTVQETFRCLRRRTGLNVSPHVMRHSFATDLMDNGADIRRVQELMHHKSIQTTSQYLHFKDAELSKLHGDYHTAI